MSELQKQKSSTLKINSNPVIALLKSCHAGHRRNSSSNSHIYVISFLIANCAHHPQTPTSMPLNTQTPASSASRPSLTGSTTTPSRSNPASRTSPKPAASTTASWPVPSPTAPPPQPTTPPSTCPPPTCLPTFASRAASAPSSAACA